MNSRTNIKKIASDTSHRRSLVSNLAVSLILHENITTTRAKSKAVVPFVERLLNIAKEANDKAQRHVLSLINNNSLASEKVFKVLVPRIKELGSGYVNIYKIGNRKGDNAPMVKLMFFGYEIPKKKGRVKQAKKAEIKEVAAPEQKKEKEKGKGLFGGRLKFGKSREEAKSSRIENLSTNTPKAKSRSGI